MPEEAGRLLHPGNKGLAPCNRPAGLIWSGMPVRVRDPVRTRRKLLEAAYREFYRRGYHGGSLSRIVESAGTTKGALFHHFPGKRALGCAVIDEFLTPAVTGWWIAPLGDTEDPVPVMRTILRRFLKRIEQETPESGFVFNGCPVCNYAAEMSPLDEGFRRRLEALYQSWRQAIAEALQRGKESGQVRAECQPTEDAAFLVAALAGIGATGKASQRLGLFQGSLGAADRYLAALQAS